MKNPFKVFKNILLIEDEPKMIAKGFAMGSFIGMLPIPGFQIMVSYIFATLFKLNKKAACIAVFNTNLATGVFIFSFNYWLGRKILGVNPSFHIRDSVNFKFISIIIKAGSDVFLSLLVGGIVVGLISSILAYYLVNKLLIKRKG